MKYLVEHEGPHVFVVYEIKGENKTKVQTFKTNHSAKKWINANSVVDQAKSETADCTYSIVEHCGPRVVSLWKRVMKGKSRKDAIRCMCLMCVGGSRKDVELCPSKYCPLYLFRETG